MPETQGAIQYSFASDRLFARQGCLLTSAESMSLQSYECQLIALRPHEELDTFYLFACLFPDRKYSYTGIAATVK